MLILFWVIVGLTFILIARNARYALRQYVLDRNRLILSLYGIFLLAFGYMVIHITARMMNLVQAAAETDDLRASPLLRRPRSAVTAQNVGD